MVAGEYSEAPGDVYVVDWAPEWGRLPTAVVTELDRGGEREKTGLGWSFIGGRAAAYKEGNGALG